jgi:hypothetical protein
MSESRVNSQGPRAEDEAYQGLGLDKAVKHSKWKENNAFCQQAAKVEPD